MQSIQLSIPSPCHEDWNKMLPEEKGKFCLSCQKTVVDFSIMSDAEILRYISTTSQNLCGHFAKDQLQRDIVEPPPIKKSRFRYVWNMFVAFILFSSKSSAQTKLTGDTVVCTPIKKDDARQVLRGKIAVAATTHTNQIVKGTVTDTAGKPIAYASVMMKGTRTGVVTDNDGNFAITVQTNQLPTIITVSSIGYRVAEVKISEDYKKPLMISLKQDDLIALGGAVVITRVRRKKTNPLQFFKKKEKPVCVKPVIEPKLTIFPNPSPVLQDVKVDWTGLDNGYWTMNVYDATGAMVFNTLINISEGLQNTVIPATHIKFKGIYVIQFTNASLKKKLSGKLLVQ